MPKDYSNLDSFRGKKDLTNKQKAKIGASIGLVVFAYVLHRKKLDAAITAMQEMANNSADAGFEAGIKYGLKLAKDSALFGKEAAEQAGQYAFGAFDKTLSAADKAAWMHTTPA